MRKKKLAIFAVFLLFLILPGSAFAQAYYFENPVRTVHVFWNADGSESLIYTFVFHNNPSGHPIEFVDLGLPNNRYERASITADVNGNSLGSITFDDFQGDGSGVAIALGSYSIPPGQSGTVTISVGRIDGVLYPDDDDENYASGVLSPAYFISSVVYGTTDMTVVYHLPPGVQPEEPRWHSAPSGFNDPPQTGFDDQGRITYTWRNPNARPDTGYTFGASFPLRYVPEESIVRTNPLALWLSNINFENLIPLFCIGAFALFIGLGIFSESKRKMQYLPPKIKIEGQGIKRGLTAVEAAILLEEPLDKILTMILFSVIKKNAARVAKKEPLSLEFAQPQPEGLHAYEIDFLNAFRSSTKTRQNELQTMFINLIKTVSNKMRGFSTRETRIYYQSITQKAWQQVEVADTPEVRSQKFDEVMEWTMLDRQYDDRTKEVFRGQPVFIPIWWGRYDPVFRPSTGGAARTVSTAPSAAGQTTMPTLPGADFAASVVNSVQSFSAGVVGNISNFTSGVTQKTNPVPVTRSGSSSRSGGGGSSCACACACAGCACACAGGGR
jgi:hypothetical protein